MVPSGRVQRKTTHAIELLSLLELSEITSTEKDEISALSHEQLRNFVELVATSVQSPEFEHPCAAKLLLVAESFADIENKDIGRLRRFVVASLIVRQGQSSLSHYLVRINEARRIKSPLSSLSLFQLSHCPADTLNVHCFWSEMCINTGCRSARTHVFLLHPHTTTFQVITMANFQEMLTLPRTNISLPTVVIHRTIDLLGKKTHSPEEIQELIVQQYGYGLTYSMLKHVAMMGGLPFPMRSADASLVTRLPHESYMLTRNALSCGLSVRQIQKEVLHNFNDSLPTSMILDIAEIEGFYPGPGNPEADEVPLNGQSDASSDTSSDSIASSNDSLTLEDHERAGAIFRLRGEIRAAKLRYSALLAEIELKRQKRKARLVKEGKTETHVKFMTSTIKETTSPTPKPEGSFGPKPVGYDPAAAAKGQRALRRAQEKARKLELELQLMSDQGE